MRTKLTDVLCVTALQNVGLILDGLKGKNPVKSVSLEMLRLKQAEQVDILCLNLHLVGYFNSNKKLFWLLLASTYKYGSDLMWKNKNQN